jgi:hypothetical protein
MVTGEHVAGQDEAGTAGAAGDEAGELLDAGTAGADEALLVAGAEEAGTAGAAGEEAGELLDAGTAGADEALLVAGAEEAGAEEAGTAGALVAGALVAGALVAGAEVAGALEAGLEAGEEAGTAGALDAGLLAGAELAGALGWVTGKEVVETTVERAGQLVTSGPQLVMVTSLVLITMETGGAAGAELTGELLDAGTAGAEAGADDGPGAWICPSPIWETMGWEA